MSEDEFIDGDYLFIGGFNLLLVLVGKWWIFLYGGFLIGVVVGYFFGWNYGGVL